MPCAVSQCSTLALFADDAKCFHTIRSASDCVLFQGDIDNLVDWSDVWKMAFKVARLDFLGGYLPSLSINYVAMSKDMEKRLPQLYYIKIKILL